MYLISTFISPYEVLADTLQSKVGFSVHQNITDKGVLPPDIPNNGQLIQYSVLPKTGVAENKTLVLIGISLLVFGLLMFVLQKRGLKKGGGYEK